MPSQPMSGIIAVPRIPCGRAVTPQAGVGLGIANPTPAGRNSLRGLGDGAWSELRAGAMGDPNVRVCNFGPKYCAVKVGMGIAVTVESPHLETSLVRACKKRRYGLRPRLAAG